MKTGKTSTGFAYTVEEDVLNNMEVLDALVDLQHEDLGALSNLLRMILPDDQRKALYEHCRDDRNRVPADKIVFELKDILLSKGGDLTEQPMKEDEEGKNS